MSGWSNTSYRGDNFDGYVPGQNDGYIPPSQNVTGGFAGTSTRSSGLDTFNNPFVHSDNTFYNPPPMSTGDTYNNPYVHNTGFIGTGVQPRDNFPHQNTSSPGFGRTILDGLNSTFGRKHTDSTISGTSTRSSFDNNDQFGSGTSFR